jgi:allophanate hydrolase subunit 2
VLGGWQTPRILGSRSSETRLKPGDVLPCESGTTPVRHVPPDDEPWETTEPTTLRVIDGPDAGILGSRGLDEAPPYRVGPSSDRMGLRLEGPCWDVDSDPERVSTPVAPGGVQWVGGRPLILGVACGTMGGYPLVAHVISADLDRLGQVRPGGAVRFARVTLGEARRLDRERRRARVDRRVRIATAAADRPLAPGLRQGD